jgi:hypothetical protein
VQINKPKDNYITILTEIIGKRKISLTEKFVNIWRIMKLLATSISEIMPNSNDGCVGRLPEVTIKRTY